LTATQRSLYEGGRASESQISRKNKEELAVGQERKKNLDGTFGTGQLKPKGGEGVRKKEN